MFREKIGDISQDLKDLREAMSKFKSCLEELGRKYVKLGTNIIELDNMFLEKYERKREFSPDDFMLLTELDMSIRFLLRELGKVSDELKFLKGTAEDKLNRVINSIGCGKIEYAGENSCSILSSIVDDIHGIFLLRRK